MSEFRRHVQGEITIDTEFSRLNIQLSVGNKCAINMSMSISDPEDVAEPVGVACKALLTTIVQELIAEHRQAKIASTVSSVMTP